MTQDKIKRLHQWYSWVLAAVLAVVGVLFIASCLDIYFSGPRPYSAEAIALRFYRIRIPVALALAGSCGGIVLNILYPQEHRRPKGASSDKDIMLRLRQKAGMPPVMKEMKLRRSLRIITAALFTTLMLYPTVYVLMLGSFTIANLNADVIRAVAVILLPAAVGLALCWVCQTMMDASYRRETAIYKQALISGQWIPSEKATERTKKRNDPLLAVRTILVTVAIIFIGIGIINGGAEDVLKKAVAICTECIGLG